MRDPRTFAWMLVAALLALGATLLWLPWWLAEHVSGSEPVPGGPLTIIDALVEGEANWPTAATAWLVALVALLLVVTFTIIWRLPARTVDQRAMRLPRDNGLRRYIDGKGPRIGRVIRGYLGTRRPMVRATTEDQIIVVAGPRTGKTTALAIPAAVEHGAGPMVVTSNKRDVYDATVGVRSEVGRVWLFDPLGLASDGVAPWWWDPLGMARDIRGARRLSTIWSKESKEPGDQTHAYFDPEGEDCLASLILAAAHGGYPVSQVYRWIAHVDDPEPVEILRDTPGCDLVAEGLQGRQDLPKQQRDGIWGTARKIVSWMDDPNARQWIEPSADREQLYPSSFATSSDTLVSLSKEGQRWATALCTALTAAVLIDTEAQAAATPAGRLDRPMLGLLDEAANVARWRELPDLYSHYGSRGIVLMSIFQSWAQMVEAFGEEGAEKLWSAANVRVYGGGVSDTDFLRRLSDLAGEWDAPHWSRSTSSRHGMQYSRSTERRPIYDVATLGAMPPGRALVMLSAARPVLVELQRWFDGPHARRINKAMAAAAAAPMVPRRTSSEGQTEAGA